MPTTGQSAGYQPPMAARERQTQAAGALPDRPWAGALPGLCHRGVGHRRLGRRVGDGGVGISLSGNLPRPLGCRKPER